MAVLCCFLLFLVTYSKFGLSANITTEPLTVQAMPLQNVTLDCRMNTQELPYIIKHPANWYHISSSGLSRQVTQAFYVIGNDSRFSLTFGSANDSAKDSSFKLGILGVMDEDDGTFVCQHQINDSTVDRKEVPFTVLHDIESVILEVRIANKTLTSSRSIQPKEPSAYETGSKSSLVTCTVKGSNPAPVVNMTVDGMILLGQPKVTPSLVGVRRAYEVKVVHNTSMTVHVNKSVVDVVCEAQLPGNHFQLRSAGIRLDVQPGITANCKNQEGKNVGDSAKIDCQITANRTALDCSKITMINATGYEVLTKVGVNTSDPRFGQMKLLCDGSNTSSLQVTIIVNSLTDDYFSTGLYLRYSNGEETTTTKLKFIPKESSGLAECPKVFTYIGARDVTVACTVTAPNCNSIRWEGKWQMPPLEYTDKRTDVEFGVLESSCKVLEENKRVKAYLKISEVKEAIFEANVNMSYNNGVQLVRVPVQIEKENVKSSRGNFCAKLSARAIVLVVLCAFLSMVYY